MTKEMESRHKCRRVTKNQVDAIPGNRIDQVDIPGAVRDLADVLADIAYRQLNRALAADVRQENDDDE